MLHSTSLPRNRVVRIRQPDFHGQRVHVATLPGIATPQLLRQLICGDQLAVSACGLYAGQVLAHTHASDFVVHSALGRQDPVFLRDPAGRGGGARILQVASTHLLVWGRVDGHPPCVWFLSPGNSHPMYRIDHLIRESGGTFKGTSPEYPGQAVHLTPWGAWPVAQDGFAVSDAAGLCVVERLAGVLHAYRMSEDGITPFRPLTLELGERAAGICWWQGRLMLAVSRGSQSWLVQLNATDGSRSARLAIDGDLHWIWTSPGGKSLAMFVRPRRENPDVRRIVLGDGRVLCEGRLRLACAVPSWSPDETQIAAVVRHVDADASSRFQVVSTAATRNLPASVQIRELLVDDAGGVCASILNDGLYDLPVIVGCAGTKVPLAWNLHHDQAGVTWTTVHDGRVFTWSMQQRR